MTTNIEIPDSTYEEVKARAAEKGMSVGAFLVDAINEKLAEEQDDTKPGLMSVFGKADKEAVAEVQRIIDEEFSN